MTSILRVFISRSLSKAIPAINEANPQSQFHIHTKRHQHGSILFIGFRSFQNCRESKTSTRTISRTILIFNASLPLLKTFVILLYTLQLLQFPSPSASNENQMQKRRCKRRYATNNPFSPKSCPGTPMREGRSRSSNESNDKRHAAFKVLTIILLFRSSLTRNPRHFNTASIVSTTL
jgi:hypothetical protein